MTRRVTSAANVRHFVHRFFTSLVVLASLAGQCRDLILERVTVPTILRFAGKHTGSCKVQRAVVGLLRNLSVNRKSSRGVSHAGTAFGKTHVLESYVC